MLFEKAVREKTRWNSKWGLLGAEDLWDLTPEELDTIFKGLARQAKAADEESLLETKSAADEELTLKIAVVKRIVEVKLVEKDAAKNAADKAAKKQKLLAILERKQDEALESKEAAEIQAMIDAL